MTKTFKYCGEVSFQKDFEVESVGNICLHAIDSLGVHYFLFIKTVLGFTSCLEFGPIVVLESDMLDDGYTITFSRFEYSDNACTKVIQKFLRNRKSILLKTKKVPIEFVEVLDFEETLKYGIDPFKYLLNEDNY